MGSLRLTLCTGLLAACALAPGAPYAADGGGAGVSVVPSSPSPGTDVALRATGCPGRTGTAASPAFVADARLTGTGGTLTGDTRVRTSARPGSYDVTLTCADAVTKGRVTVLGRVEQAPPQAPSQVRPQVLRQPQRQPRSPQHGSSAAPLAAPASPVASVDADGSGAAHFASVDVRGAGPGTGQAITGLVLAGVAAAAVGVLSARRRRGTDRPDAR
ncbi:hypothetical protein LXH13_15795 [Streptomyces spinosirectus]|uniref:hypothetical protein n=1 Tax=Streptomyces TaxID=1883 RepID=UPI000FFE451E|nr:MULTISPECIES: hypothetical protein [Streptomyces]MBY8340364.1 hypothetical protein [Streptomyces plumbidurans]UIR18417.1 hypothetical protein LXH13_15795 [Streptomyces spinosirectus]